VGGAAVEGRPENDDIRLGIRPGLVKVTSRYAKERDVRSELWAVPRHVGDPSDFSQTNGQTDGWTD